MQESAMVVSYMLGKLKQMFCCRFGHMCLLIIKYSFVFFAVTVKYSIEKNLLSDVALAIHSGISVEEILADLIGKGK